MFEGPAAGYPLLLLVSSSPDSWLYGRLFPEDIADRSSQLCLSQWVLVWAGARACVKCNSRAPDTRK